MSQFKIYVTPAALREIESLPGNMRQRIRREINSLATAPRPAHSKQLQMPELPRELWRLRIDRWRIVYAVTSDDAAIDILAVRKRPPYDYGDLEGLLGKIK
jgi:mRNA interferase RelE/StbE